MNIILIIINISFVLSRGVAQFNGFYVTRFNRIEFLFRHSCLIRPQTDSILNMSEGNRKNLCMNVFTSPIFIFKEDTMRDIISRIIKQSINNIINNNVEPQPLTYERKVISFETGGGIFEKVFCCFRTEEISLYIRSDGLTETRYFAFYHMPYENEMKILGLVEPNASFDITINTKLDKYYFEQRQLVDESTLYGRSRFFNNLYEDEALRTCSSAFKYVTETQNTSFQIYTVEAIKTNNNHTSIKPIKIGNGGFINDTTPVLKCAVREYPEGAALPPITIHIIPDFNISTSVFLIEPISIRYYKLKTHLYQLSSLLEKDLEFRKVNRNLAPHSQSGFRLLLRDRVIIPV